ncbi:calpain-5-like [Lineus longissimus]|uniref:calpain-5-like n=1 Tax=Lineus longissimus TaxID=88925 RepID=UPI002B4ED23E
MVRAWKGQKYNSLKSQCKKNGELFVDPEFPPNTRSLFHSKIDNSVVWKRPGEICKVPKFIVAGVTCDDLNQGDLGNCWFVSACAGLAKEPKMFQKVVPESKAQEWPPENKVPSGDGEEKTGNYWGIFHFRFWRYGDLIDVVVDDLLPTKDGKLLYCHSKARNEFWSALLEKAYAKLYGDYEKLNTGFTSDALVDFTGGVAEKIPLSSFSSANEETKFRLFIDLQDAVLGSSFVTANIECGQEQVGSDAQHGLIKGHGYMLTNVMDMSLPKPLQAQYNKPSIKMIRLNNPWGTKEWTGPWSDDSPEWTQLTQKDRNKLGMKFQKEGDFWMSFDDFVKNFTKVEICHIVNTAIVSIKKSWSEAIFRGKWTVGVKGSSKDRSGGNEKHLSFLYNPQYVFDINGDQDSIIVSLEQNDIQIGAQTVSIDEIGFHIMQVESNRKYRVHIPMDKVYVSDYTKSRNVFKRVPLKRGRYIIIPSTSNPGIASEFLLRLYSSKKNGGRELLQEAPKPAMPCLPKLPLVTQVIAVKAAGLEKSPKPKETTDPFVVIKCEGDSVKGLHQKCTQEPAWGTKAIFYRKKPDLKPVVIEVWNKNRVVDDFMGMAEIEDRGQETKPAVVTVELYGKGKEGKGQPKEVKKQGKVTVELRSSTDLEYF